MPPIGHHSRRPPSRSGRGQKAPFCLDDGPVRGEEGGTLVAWHGISIPMGAPESLALGSKAPARRTSLAGLPRCGSFGLRSGGVLVERVAWVARPQQDLAPIAVLLVLPTVPPRQTRGGRRLSSGIQTTRSRRVSVACLTVLRGVFTMRAAGVEGSDQRGAFPPANLAAFQAHEHPARLLGHTSVL